MSLHARLSALQFFQNAVFAASVLTVSTYLLEALAFSGRQVGMIYATNALAATVTPPLVGWLADRHFRADRLLVYLNLVAAAAIGSCFFATSFPLVYALILLFNLCFIPTFALLTSVCFHVLERPNQQYPRIRVWGTVSFVLVGLALSYFGIESSPWPLMVAAGLALAFGLTALSLPSVPPHSGFRLSDLAAPQTRRLLRAPGMLVLLLAVLLSCLPGAFYYSFLNPFLNEMGWTNAAAKMVIGQVAEIFVIITLPFAFRRIRFRWLVFWGLFFWGARYFAFAVGRPEEWELLLYAGVAVQGFAFAWTVIAAQLYVHDRVPVALRSTAQGVISFVSQGLGIFIGSYLAGEVVSNFALAGGGYDWYRIWLVPGAIGLVVAVGFLVLFPRGERLEKGGEANWNE